MVNPIRPRISPQKIKGFDQTLLDHLPYSPDLQPSDYYLFRNLKSEIFNRKFVGENGVEPEVSEYFFSKSTDWFKRGLEMYYDQIMEFIKNKTAIQNFFRTFFIIFLPLGGVMQKL